MSGKTVLIPVVPGRKFLVQENSGKTLTVPGEAPPLRQIIESFSRGEYTDVRTHAVHFDGIDDFDSPLASIDRMDIADVHNLALQYENSGRQAADYVEKSKTKSSRKADGEATKTKGGAKGTEAEPSESSGEATTT